MLRTSNIDDIDKITIIPYGLKRRIMKECQQIRNSFDEIIVECTSNEDILVSIKRKKNSYIFKIPQGYPFHNPTVSINGLTQHQFFDLKTKRFITTLPYVSGMDCLCCNSYLCQNNWNISITLGHVVNQIECFKMIKYLIFLKIILDKIKDKYLISDIELDSWLFIPFNKST